MVIVTRFYCQLCLGLAICWCTLLAGCAAVTSPIANGIPAHRLPPELRGESKENMDAIPLTSLRQPPPEAYRLAPEDVLGVWIEGVLGEKGQVPPVHSPEKGNLPPAIGLPIPVRPDGTIALPYISPLKVEGMTLVDVEAAIRKAYTVDKQILKPGRERIFVTLQQPRRYHILVIRQDSGANTAATSAFGGGSSSSGFVIALGTGAGGTHSGKGYALDLPAYQNDVLNALAETGGFPGSDAMNEIIVERGGAKKKTDKGAGVPASDKQAIRIPLRVRKGEKLAIRPEDVILNTGDVVYIRGRELQYYYTGGMLISGAWPIPRDTDLDVIEAICQSRGTLNNGGISTLNTAGITTSIGIGAPSPTLLTVLRKTPNGKQVNIRVDLNLALREPRERILVQPEDILLLQFTPQQALARYLSEQFHLNGMWELWHTSRSTGTGTGTVP